MGDIYALVKASGAKHNKVSSWCNLLFRPLVIKYGWTGGRILSAGVHYSAGAGFLSGSAITHWG